MQTTASRRLIRRIVAAAIVTVVSGALAACAPASAESGADEEETSRTAQTVVDELGREIELELPVERAAVAFYYYNVELVRGVGASDRIVAIGADGITTTDANEGYWDGIDELPVIGEAGVFNYDAIVEANPEVLITGSNSPWEEAAEKLEPFGIPVIVLTGWDPKVFHHGVELLGQVFGEEERADELIGLFDEVDALLDERVSDVEPKSVYFENGTENTTGVKGSGWHDIIELAGGTNLFEDIVFGEGENTQGTVHTTPVDPATILERDPDLVLRHGVDGFDAGYQPWDVEAAEAKAGELVSRPGWSELSAVQDDRVYVVNNFFTSALSKEIGALGLATWLHPEQFEGVDTEQYFRRWVEDFQETPYIDQDEYIYHHESGDS